MSSPALSSTSALSPSASAGLSTVAAESSRRERRRAHIASRLLDGLESLLERNRALLVEPDAGALHVDLIAAEVAHELEIARAALRRAPALIAVPRPDPAVGDHQR